MSQPTTIGRLPPEAEMDRDDALDAFVAVVNTVEPDHPYWDNPFHIDRDDVKFGVTRNYYARCGPLRGRVQDGGAIVSYSTRMTYINGISRERHLALLTHEVSHIPFGSRHGNQHGSHAPEFWREMAFHALLVRDSLRDGDLASVFPDADVDRYLKKVAADAGNGSTVDERYWSTEECRAEVSRLIGLEE